MRGIEMVKTSIEKDINRRKVWAFNEKSRRERWNIEVFDISGWEIEIPFYGVNWGALGPQNPKDAKLFVKHLNEAIKLCEQLNRS